MSNNQTISLSNEVDLSQAVLVDNKHNLQAFIQHFVKGLTKKELDTLRKQFGFNLINIQG